MRTLFKVATLATACLYANAAQAADDHQLNPVIVTGSRTASIARELPTGTVVLSHDQIQAMPATNLAGVLDTVAGINVRRQYGVNGSRSTVDLGGFGATAVSNTLILLNGHRYNNVDSASPDLDSIPLSAIQRIEVLPGAGAALYGNGAVGGVINIVTREHYANHAGAEATGGSYGTKAGRLWGTGSKDGVSAAASVRAINSDGYRDNNRLQQRNAFADVRSTLDDGTTLYLTATGEKQKLGLPGARSVNLTTGVNQADSDRDGTDTPNDWAEQKTITVSPGLTVPVGERNQLHLDFSGHRKWQRYYYAGGGFPTYGKSHVDSYSVNPRLTSQFETGLLHHNTTVGWDLYDYDLNNRSAASKAQIGQPTYTKDVQQTQKAWYGHDLIAVGRWSLTLGARHLSVETDSSTTGYGTGNGRDHQDADMYEGGVRYHFDDGLDVFAGAQRSVRIINADEISPGDGLLKPQTGHDYTLGASWRKGIQDSTLTVWRGTYENEIVYNPYAGPFGANVNLADRTLRKGVTLNSHWRLDPTLTLTLNGTFQRAEFDSGQWQGNDVPLVPRQQYYAQADWQALPWLQVSLAHRYVGKRYFDNDQPNSFRRLDSYQMSDLELTARYRHAYLRIGAYNLEDEKAADYGVKSTSNLSYNLYPLPERNYRVSIGMEL